MIRWFRSLFAWRVVLDTCVNAYEVNNVSGQRRVRRLISGGYSPVDYGWVETGEWTKPGPPPFGVAAKDA